jgi:hypothetical protein
LISLITHCGAWPRLSLHQSDIAITITSFKINYLNANSSHKLPFRQEALSISSPIQNHKTHAIISSAIMKLSMQADKTDVQPSEKLQEKVAPTPVAEMDKQAPPSYAYNDPELDAPTGPSAELSAAFASLNISNMPPTFPQADHCLAHLKLLSTFNAMKEDVGYTDGLFGLWDAKCEMTDNKEKTLALIREKRWALYVARAVDRFEGWWLNVLCANPNVRLQSRSMVENVREYSQFTSIGQPQKWTPEALPPIGKF